MVKILVSISFYRSFLETLGPFSNVVDPPRVFTLFYIISLILPIKV